MPSLCVTPSMRTLIITSCTNRKRATDVATLCARDLAAGGLQQVVNRWVKKLNQQLMPNKAKDTYCGRGFAEALRAVEVLDAKFLIVSAGLGLVKADIFIPRYNATISSESPDCVLQKLNGTNGTAQSWWTALNQVSPFATRLDTNKFDLILVGLPKSYFALMQSSLDALPVRQKAKLRLFLRAPASSLPTSLRQALMPYDGRLDSPLGPLPGTQGDFAQRAMRHFAEFVLNGNEGMDAPSHAKIVEKHLKTLDIPIQPTREKVSDEYILESITTHWATVGGQSTQMLRFLRDHLQIACQQKRFQFLFNKVKAKRIATASK
jgi:hypothetical protein